MTIQINKNLYQTLSQKCVKCGKCLSVCPVFDVFKTEEFSPRGRFVVFEQSSELFSVYCLGCLKCKKSCPFELSVLDFVSPKFVWKNQFLDSINDYLKTLFDVIYFSQKKIVFDSTPKGLLMKWAKKRGLIDNIKNKENVDILLNPFSIYFYPETKKLFKCEENEINYWQKILEEFKL